jgi:type I restriction enzyme S subunit
MIGRVLIPIPPVDEQVAIVTFLDHETAKIDALVEEQKRLIELLKEKRQAVISQAVTKGLDPTVPMKDSGVEWLGQVPAHWQVTRLGNLFRDVDERGHGDLPVLSVSIHDGVSDDELDESELDRKVTRSDDRTKYKRVSPGDLTYNMMRAWQGGFGSVALEGMVSPAYVVARPKTNFPTAYVERLLRTPNAIEEMRRRSRGVTDFRLRLYWEEFKDIKVALPTEAEAKAVLLHLSGLDAVSSRATDVAETCIALLQERRSALISAAVTGKIDVRGLVPQPEATPA